MSHKKLATFALLMVLVFGGLVALYPRLFSSEKSTPSAAPVAEPPTPSSVTSP